MTAIKDGRLYGYNSPDTSAQGGRFREAVARWLVGQGYPDPTGISIECGTDSCDTCGGGVEIDLTFQSEGASRFVSISPYDLGAFIGELL